MFPLPISPGRHFLCADRAPCQKLQAGGSLVGTIPQVLLSLQEKVGPQVLKHHSLLYFDLVCAFKAIYPNKVRRNKNNDYFEEDVLYIDPFIPFNKFSDLPWPLLGTIFGLALTAFLPICALCLYPIKLCRRVLFCSKLQIPRMFVETYTGHYKDGTGGTRDYRAASSLVFILRLLAGILLYSLNARSDQPTSSSVFVYFLVMVSLFYTTAKPCKGNFTSNLEGIIYSFTALSLLFVTHTDLNPHFTPNMSLRPALF